MSPARPFRARRDFAGLKRRRLRAGAMLAAGQTQAEVAQALGVSRQSAGRWAEQWRAGGTAALPTTPQRRRGNFMGRGISQALYPILLEIARLDFGGRHYPPMAIMRRAGW